MISRHDFFFFVFESGFFVKLKLLKPLSIEHLALFIQISNNKV